MNSIIKPARKPRRYHKKSSTGCKRCKQRKIKCDENRLPLGCKNCQRHKFACSFIEEPNERELCSAEDRASNEGTKTKGSLTGHDCAAVSGLILQLRSQFTAGSNSLQMTDYLFVHHTVTSAAALSNQRRSQCTKWINGLPRLLDASTSTPFAMHVLIAFCIQHAFWNHQAPTEHLQRLFYHRGKALRGLREQVEWLSDARTEHCGSGVVCTTSLEKATEVAAVTAGFLLAQTMEWRDWVSLTRGFRTTLEPLSTCDACNLGRRPLLLPLSSAKAGSPKFGFSPSVACGFLLPAVCASLEALTTRIFDNDILRNVQQLCLLLFDIRIEPLNCTLSKLLRRLQPLRSIFFWFPSALLEGDSLDTTKAAILALMYCAGLCLEHAYTHVHVDFQQDSVEVNLESVQLDGISLYLGGPFLSLAREAFQILRSFKDSEDLPEIVNLVEQVLDSTSKAND